MTNPKVTVALTTYNRPEYLKLAIDAILAQTYKEFEFLILDNGSEIETEALIKTYTDERIKYVRNKSNTREFVNVAWDLANGEYLIITHDDDIMKKDMLEKEIIILDKFPDVIGVSCNNTSIDSNGNIINKKVFPLDSPIEIKQYEYIYYYLKKSIYLIFPSLLMRKSFFIKNNLKFELNVGPGADTYLWMKANLLPCSFYILNEPLYYYRFHDKQDSYIYGNSIKLELFEALLDLFIGVGYLKNLELIINRLLRNYVINYHFKLISKEIYNNKIDFLVAKLKLIKHKHKLLFKVFIYKKFTFILIFIYRILLRMRSLKVSNNIF